MGWKSWSVLAGAGLSMLIGCAASPAQPGPQEPEPAAPKETLPAPTPESERKVVPAAAAPKRKTDAPQEAFPLPEVSPRAVATDPLGVTVSKDGIWVVGRTTGALAGQEHRGGEDAFLIRFDERLGQRTFLSQFGTPTRDVAHDVRQKDDVLYVVGATGGSLGGQEHRGGRDGFVQQRRAADGAVLWTLQVGTPLRDEVRAVDVDMMGNVFVAGTTRGPIEGRTHHGETDIFVQKYSKTGELKWTTTLGRAGEDELTAFRLGNLGEPQVLLSHDASPLKLDPTFGVSQLRAQSIVRLDERTGKFLDGAHFERQQTLPIFVLGAPVRLRPLPADTSYDFALAPGGDWLLATGEMNTDGMCPSHDGDLPSVERLSASAGRTKWKQVAALQAGFSTMIRFESSSLSDVVGDTIYEAGVTGGQGVYARSITVRNGAERWIAELEGQLVGTPQIAAARGTVVMTWQTWDREKGSEPARIQLFDFSTGKPILSRLLDAQPSDVPAEPEPGAPVTFCGRTYSGEAESTQVVCKNPKKVLDLRPLLQLPGLDSLEIEGALIADFSVLSELKSLERLALRDCQINNLSVLASVVQVKELDLSDNDFGDLSPLSALSELKVLDLSENELFSLTPLRSLPSLETLVLRGANMPTLEGLDALPELRNLDLSQVKALPPLAPLASVPQLARLRLAANGKMDLTPLTKVDSLTHLDISYCAWFDLSPLLDINSLRFVNLRGHKKERIEDLVARRPELLHWEEEPQEVVLDSSEDSQFDREVERLHEEAAAAGEGAY